MNGQDGKMLPILLLRVMVIVFHLAYSADSQTTSFFINCGSNASVTVDGRRWVGDVAPGSNVTLSFSGVDASTSYFDGDPLYKSLYTTSRIFSANSNYTFPAQNGHYFLRLHFYPFDFDMYDTNTSYFAVSANGLNLVSEFNVRREIRDKLSNLNSSSYLMKEYFFSVDQGVVVVNFVPSRGSFGFINAMELVSVPSLFVDEVYRVGGGNASLSSGLGIETMYRLKVGGTAIPPSQDPNLWRTWEADKFYMIHTVAGNEIRNRSKISYADSTNTAVAPLVVYETAKTLANITMATDQRFNMSWKLVIDPDFDYLVRLHFCELAYNGSNQRLFRVFIDNQTAADNFDIYSRSGGMNQAWHEDYLDSISGENTLWVQVGPETVTSSSDSDPLLNGLEVFKLSQNGNLAYVRKNRGRTSRTILWVGISVGIALIASISGLLMLIFCFRKKKGEQNDGKQSNRVWRPLSIFTASTVNAKGSVNHHNPNGQFAIVRSGRRFTLTEIRSATNDFDESLVIGVGGFGKVYKAEIDENALVAVKRSNPQSQQGLREFETEIELLSKLRHRHLVSLIGFCDENNEMILVYEYMGNGTLRSHLLGSDLPPLTWKQRLEICIGAARGLHYLHTGSECGIIHRDVKTTNILLDENFVAKMADFGLSKTGPSLEHTHVSTAVKGSFGYLDPEYFRRQQLTEKSDVYSFGVVLFEVACARAVINPTLPKDEINLAEWALRKQREGSLETIVDPQLKGGYAKESMMKFGEIGEKCLADEGKSRPTMGEVLWHLEYVLQLHESWLQDAAGNLTEVVVVAAKGEEESSSEAAAADCSDNAVSQIESREDEESVSILSNR